MIYLLTGSLSLDKTKHAVSVLLNNDFKDRTVFYSSKNRNVNTWQNWLPDGAVYIIDEAEKHFPIRPKGFDVPYCVSELMTHRHRALDFILITKDVSLLDTHVSALVVT